MFNCTDAFLTRHVRNLSTLDGGTSRANVVHRAGIILQARQEETGHNYPNTVMFLHPQDMVAISHQVAQVGASQHANINVRVPYVVTWTGVSTYSVVTNASGFVCATNAQGECCHYGGVLRDQQSPEYVRWLM